MSYEASDEQFIDKQETHSLSDEYTTVKIRKIFTPAGERVELEAPELGRSIRLDAIEIESLSWQEPETFIEFLDAELPGLPDNTAERQDFVRNRGDPDMEAGSVAAEITVTNEFAEAIVRVIELDGKQHLELEASKLDYKTRLCPIEAETVTWQTTETFTDFLEHPFGPDGH